MARRPSREAEAAAEQQQRKRYAEATLTELIDELIRRGVIAPEHRERLLARIEEKVTEYFRMLGLKIGRDLQKTIDETTVFVSFARTFLRRLRTGQVAIESDVFAYMAQIMLFKISDYANKELGRLRRPTGADADTKPARHRPRTTAFSEVAKSGDDGDERELEQSLAIVRYLYDLPDVELRAEANWLAELIERLPEPYREVLLMKYQEYTDAEIDAKLRPTRRRGHKADEPTAEVSQYAVEGHIDVVPSGRPNWVKHTLVDAFWALCLACGRCPRCREPIPRGRQVSACPNPDCGTMDPKTGKFKPTTFPKKIREMAANLNQA